MYEVINEELGIKACNLADLTAEQMSNFLGQWEEGARIGTLTLFYESETGAVVLNKDNEMYSEYLSLAEDYLGAEPDVRREVRDKCPESVKETLNVLENCLKSRRIEKELFRARKNHITSKPSRMVLDSIISRYNGVAAVFMAFRYGVMQGKRMERAKKHKMA